MSKNVLALFGFLRNGEKFAEKYNNFFENYDTYIAMPKQKFEDKDDSISNEQLQKMYNKLNIKHIYLWDYDKTIFQNKVPEIVPKFNQYFQQAWRIYSFFYHVMKSVESIPSDVDNIIILRSDVNITNFQEDELNKIMSKYDLTVKGGKNNHSTQYVDDKFFIIKRCKLNAMMSLYDDFTKYLIEYYDPKSVVKTRSWRPEDIWGYHLINKNKLKTYFSGTSIINIKFAHVCSKYCGHNKEKTAS